MSEATDFLRRESLRRQVDLLTQIRDAMTREPSEDYDRWADALVPLTDRIIHELMALEGVPPYPHPMGTWDALLRAENAEMPEMGNRAQ